MYIETAGNRPSNTWLKGGGGVTQRRVAEGIARSSTPRTMTSSNKPNDTGCVRGFRVRSMNRVPGRVRPRTRTRTLAEDTEDRSHARWILKRFARDTRWKGRLVGTDAKSRRGQETRDEMRRDESRKLRWIGRLGGRKRRGEAGEARGLIEQME